MVFDVLCIATKLCKSCKVKYTTFVTNAAKILVGECTH